jgi:phosphoglycerate dehydrogenase-like enzyme
MQRPSPDETKLLLCVHHPFTLWRLPDELPARIRDRWPQMKVAALPDSTRLGEELEDADIYVGFWARPELFRRARKLRWVHATAAGVSQLLHAEFVASDVVLTNARGVNAEPIGDHAMGMILAFARHLPSAWRHQKEHRWAQQEIWDERPRPMELGGQTLVLVGLGAVGGAIARRARGFGMRILAVTRSGHDTKRLTDEIFAADRLDEALEQADFVVLAAPDTPATKHLMDERRLGLMKPAAYLVNVSRGALVDETALAQALREHRIAGAALDVAEREPLDAANPLWELENVQITPHIANASERLWERQAAILLENLERWFAGRELLNVVNKQRGY